MNGSSGTEPSSRRTKTGTKSRKRRSNLSSSARAEKGLPQLQRPDPAQIIEAHVRCVPQCLTPEDFGSTRKREHPNIAEMLTQLAELFPRPDVVRGHPTRMSPFGDDHMLRTLQRRCTDPPVVNKSREEPSGRASGKPGMQTNHLPPFEKPGAEV